MAHWYEPKKKWKEWRKHRESPLSLGLIRKRPRDRFYNRLLFDIVILRPKERYVVLPFGGVGKIKARLDDEDNLIHPDDTETEVAHMETESPSGGVKKGIWGNLHIRFAPYGVVQQARVFTGQRFDRFAQHDVTTADPFTLPEVDAMLSYRVVDPLKALTVPEGGDFQNYVKEFAGARLTDVVSNHSLDQLLRATSKKSNYSWIASNEPQPDELNRAGLVVDTIQFSELRLTPQIDAIVRSRAQAIYQGDALRAEADAKKYAAKTIFEGLEGYKDNPAARAAYMADVASKSPNGNVTHNEAQVKFAEAAEKLADAVKKLVDKF